MMLTRAVDLFFENFVHGRSQLRPVVDRRLAAGSGQGIGRFAGAGGRKAVDFRVTRGRLPVDLMST